MADVTSEDNQTDRSERTPPELRGHVEATDEP